jgi:hypothetical protein
MSEIDQRFGAGMFFHRIGAGNDYLGGDYSVIRITQSPLTLHGFSLRGICYVLSKGLTLDQIKESGDVAPPIVSKKPRRRFAELQRI